MGIYVMVTADFPQVNDAQRKQIYECLEKKNWHKVQNIGRDISTVWYGRWESTDEQSAINQSIREFTECCKPYTTPRLLLHAGHNEPTRHSI